MNDSAEPIRHSFVPREIAFPAPKNPHVVIHLHMTFLKACAMIHLTTTSIGESGSSTAPLGSFVYAMPDRSASRGAISTALQSSGPSLDYATRLSKILAIKMNQPVYVGTSMNLMGITTEEELEGLTEIVKMIMEAFDSSTSREDKP